MSTKIGDFVTQPRFSSPEELLKQVRHLPDGIGFLSTDPSAIWKTLFQLPPNAEFDFDARHFQAQLPIEQITPLTQEFLQRKQFVAFHWSAPGSWQAEAAFVQTNKTTSIARKPLILHFASTIDSFDLEFQKRFAAETEIVHIGTQMHCTSRESLDETFNAGMKVLPLKKIENLLQALEGAAQIGFQRPTWIRLNMNSLASAEGGSADAWASGFRVAEFLSCLEWWIRQTLIVGFSIGGEGLEKTPLAVRSAAQIFSTLAYHHTNRRVVSSAHGKKANEISS